MNQSTFSRRTLAKGAAWSVPTIAIATAAPAFAASQCRTDIWSSSGLYEDARSNSQYVMIDVSFGRIGVTDIPVGVTVTSVTTTWYLAHDDFRWLNNTTGTGNGAQYQAADGTWKAFSTSTGTMTYRDLKASTATKPVSNTAQYNTWGSLDNTGPTGKDTPHDYATYTSTWTPTQTNNTLRQGVYSAGSTASCRDFEISEMGAFYLREPMASTLYNDGRWRAYQTFEVTLSNGTVIKWATWDPSYTPEYGTQGGTSL